MSRRIALAAGADLAGFRSAVRALIAEDVWPDEVVWSAEDAPDLFGEAPAAPGTPLVLPRPVAVLIETVACHRDTERYALLYQLVWRVLHGERALLEIASDPLVARLEDMRKSVGRDIRKMHAFLRFRQVLDPDGTERFVAWFEPEHFILEATAGFFVERFESLVWSILTPDGSLHWDRRQLLIGPAARRSDAPDGDAFEAGWRAYYESTFNPARVNPAAMIGEMPKKYWRNMPETAAIPEMLRAARGRTAAMIEREASVPVKRDPEKAVAQMAEQAPASLEALNRIIAASPPLVPGATRAVLGEGPVGAAVAFVGEQPGDQEDLQGRPFVGPAGQLLDRALAEVGIERKTVYVTNAVKHFKFEQRGKKRIHQKPTTGEVKHYRWWLMRELELVHPRHVVALGGTAVLALTGKALPITRVRGRADFEGRPGYITVHPSYLLRLPDEAEKRRAYAAFVADLRQVREMIEAPEGLRAAG
jgi:DNA polymerase